MHDGVDDCFPEYFLRIFPFVDTEETGDDAALFHVTFQHCDRVADEDRYGTVDGTVVQKAFPARPRHGGIWCRKNCDGNVELGVILLWENPQREKSGHGRTGAVVGLP